MILSSAAGIQDKEANFKKRNGRRFASHFMNPEQVRCCLNFYKVCTLRKYFVTSGFSRITGCLPGSEPALQGVNVGKAGINHGLSHGTGTTTYPIPGTVGIVE